MNEIKVFPSIMYGSTVDRGSRVELLLLSQSTSNVWKTLVKPGRRMRKGAKFIINGTNGKQLISNGIVREIGEDKNHNGEVISELKKIVISNISVIFYILAWDTLLRF